MICSFGNHKSLKELLVELFRNKTIKVKTEEDFLVVLSRKPCHHSFISSPLIDCVVGRNFVCSGWISRYLGKMSSFLDDLLQTMSTPTPLPPFSSSVVLSTKTIHKSFPNWFLHANDKNHKQMLMILRAGSNCNPLYVRVVLLGQYLFPKCLISAYFRLNWNSSNCKQIN